MKRVFLSVLTILAGAGQFAQAQGVSDVLSEDERLSTLAQAVTAAGLSEALAGHGPFTVYAPSNTAFAALPAGMVETLLQPENADQLQNVLLYHVDDRHLRSVDFPAGSTRFKPLLTSARLCVTNSAGVLQIDDGSGAMATVVAADIKADNGVIHIIDKVLLPDQRPDCRHH